MDSRSAPAGPKELGETTCSLVRQPRSRPLSTRQDRNRGRPSPDKNLRLRQGYYRPRGAGPSRGERGGLQLPLASSWARTDGLWPHPLKKRSRKRGSAPRDASVRIDPPPTPIHPPHPTKITQTRRWHAESGAGDVLRVPKAICGVSYEGRHPGRSCRMLGQSLFLSWIDFFSPPCSSRRC